MMALFHRLEVENWHAAITLLAFVLIAGAFLFILVRTLFMPAKKLDHLASLPLEEEKTVSKNGSDHGQTH